MNDIVHPPGWPKPRGYSQAIAASGRHVFVAGQIGWNPLDGRFPSTRLHEQVRQALENIVTILAAAEARPEHIVRMTWYVTSRAEYLAEAKEIGAAYRAVIGKHFPAMAVVEVRALVESEAQVEIEATAVVP